MRSNCARFLGTSILAVLAASGLTLATAQAQRVLPNSQSAVNPFFRVAPNLPLNQAAFNVATAGQAFGQVPPFLFGFNPFPSPVITPFAVQLFSSMGRG